MPEFADVSLLSLILLVGGSFLGSLMTAALGVGGGAFLLAIMADILPPLALIPIHGVVQLGSNGGRAVLARNHIQTRLVTYFLTGALVATLLSVFLLSAINADWIPLLVAAFILWLCWGPIPELGLAKTPGGVCAGGLLTTLATMVLGATGPLVSAWLGRTGTDRWEYTANFSACMTIQHSLKIVVFCFAGFSFLPWAGILLMMLVAGYLGTQIGLRVLGKIPENKFKPLFKWVLSLLALRLIWQSVIILTA